MDKVPQIEVKMNLSIFSQSFGLPDLLNLCCIAPPNRRVPQTASRVTAALGCPCFQAGFGARLLKYTAWPSHNLFLSPRLPVPHRGQQTASVEQLDLSGRKKKNQRANYQHLLVQAINEPPLNWTREERHHHMVPPPHTRTQTL